MIILPAAPPEAGVDNLTRHPDCVKGLEEFGEHGPLLANLKGLPQGMSERPAQEHGSRGLHLFGILPHYRYADCRYACLLDGALYQTDGLIADASGRDKNYCVHTI